MKIYDIVSKRIYEKDGEKKTMWLKCGTLRVAEDGNKYIRLNMMPDTDFYVFEHKAMESNNEQI